MSPKDQDEPPLKLTPELLLHAYAAGVFPMAESAQDLDIMWVNPVKRGILPLDHFIVSRSLRKRVRRGDFEIRCNTAFEQVINLCAEQTAIRTETWINSSIRSAVIELHRLGHAHSVETWQDGDLKGGLYGISLGSAFFGESMFSRATDASKVALVHLVTRLRLGGFKLLDTQFVTDHLLTFGAIEISDSEYHMKLKQSARPTALFPENPHAQELENALEEVFALAGRH